MIDLILYLKTSRPNIMFFVCNCARYQATPREPHLTTTKNIFLYLHRTPTLGIWYHVNIAFLIQVYFDANFGGFQLDRKSTSRRCQLLYGKLVRWQSNKQTNVSISTSEAAYTSVVSTTLK